MPPGPVRPCINQFLSQKRTGHPTAGPAGTCIATGPTTPTSMHLLLRTITWACAASLGAAAMAQNTITVFGNVTPCNGTPYPVWIFSDPGTVPMVDTVINTNVNCNYTFTFHPINSTGGIAVKTSCDGGLTWGLEDSLAYNAGPANMDSLMVDLACSAFNVCEASFTVHQAEQTGALVPWQITTNNLSTGTGALSYQWWLPDGSTSSAAEPGYTFSAPGAYGFCLTVWNADSTCTATACDTVVVDTIGFVNTIPAWYDCLNVLWGPNNPGTACDDNDPMTFNTFWTSGCECLGVDTAFVDCLGIPGGSAMPGTGCTTFLGMPGTWNLNCFCVPDTTTGCTACMTITQGAPFTGLFTSCSTGGNDSLALIWDFSDAGSATGDSVWHTFPGPGVYTVCINVFVSGGTSCWTCESVVVDAQGNINPPVNTPCEANFWVIQAYDSTAGGIEPIPNEVWVWNLSSGGNGSYQFTWDFGDGTTSTEAFPSHTYDGPGPWLLCLTMVSGDTLSGGCTDIHCDSVSVDENGILNGMAPLGGGHPVGSNDRSGGFTLNVVQGTPTNLPETPSVSELRLWPNPAEEVLNIAVNGSISGMVPLEVLAADGRVILRADHRFNSGNGQLVLPIGQLEAGLYLVRIGNGTAQATQRFLKAK